MMPLILVGIGHYMAKGHLKEINWAFGYRTFRATRNKETWNFAQALSGRLMRNFGLASLAVSVVAILLVSGQDEAILGPAITVVMGLQFTPIILAIILTERALRQNFEKDGRRKDSPE